MIPSCQGSLALCFVDAVTHINSKSTERLFRNMHLSYLAFLTVLFILGELKYIWVLYTNKFSDSSSLEEVF